MCGPEHDLESPQQKTVKHICKVFKVKQVVRVAARYAPPLSTLCGR